MLLFAPHKHKWLREEQSKAFKRAAPRRSGRPSVGFDAARDMPNRKAANFILISKC
jgi:hypothetical protein